MAVVNIIKVFEEKDVYELRPLLDILKLKNKEQDEAYNAVCALKVWSDYLSPKLGTIKKLEHCSNPDDPPDIKIYFEDKMIGMEVAFIDSSYHKWAEAIRCEEKLENRIVAMPFESSNFSNREQIIKTLCNIYPKAWVAVEKEVQAVGHRAITKLSKKMKRPENNWCLLLKSFTNELEIREVSKYILQRLPQLLDHFSKKDFKIIIHSQPNQRSFTSTFIEQGTYQIKEGFLHPENFEDLASLNEYFN